MIIKTLHVMINPYRVAAYISQNQEIDFNNDVLCFHMH